MPARKLSYPPLFFLPFPVFAELLGVPKGSGVFRVIAEASGSELPVDRKTLGNFFDPHANPSRKTQDKMMAWIAEATRHDYSESLFDFMSQFEGQRRGAVDWRCALYGLAKGSDDTFFPKTLDYIVALLDQENEWFEAARSHKEQPELLLNTLMQGSYFRKYALPVDDDLLQQVLDEFPHDPAVALVQKPEVRRSIVHGLVCLLMDIFAKAEVEWFESNNASLPEADRFSGHLVSMLPVVEGKQLSLPVTSFFNLIKGQFGFKPWDKLAEFVEMKGEADIASKKRSLFRWKSGEHYPEMKTVNTFLTNIVQSFGDYHAEYYQCLYVACAFLTRFLERVTDDIAEGKVTNQQLLQAFAT